MLFASSLADGIGRITAVGGYLEHLLPGGNVLAWTIHLVLDISIVTLLFAMIFKFLPDARLSWRDVRLGAALTAGLFLVGKYALGLYLVIRLLNNSDSFISHQVPPSRLVGSC